jgi:hypothetical protein
VGSGVKQRWAIVVVVVVVVTNPYKGDIGMLERPQPTW